MPITKEVLKRSQINEADKWKTEDIFENEALWEDAFKYIKSKIPDISSFSGRLGEGASVFLSALNLMETVEQALDKVYAYASLKKDENSTVSDFQSLFGRAQSLYVEYSEASSYIVPEILSIPSETIEKFFDEEPALKLYTHMIDDINRNRPHTLDVEKEQLLAAVGDLSTGPRNIYDMIRDADMKFGLIKGEDGEDVELTQERYTSFMESSERSVREQAFNRLYETYGKQKNTIAATYNASVKKDIFYARVRNHPSALEAALFGDNVDPAVYDNLINSVNNNMDKLHRYVSLRKRALGLDELHMYDLYCPIVKDIKVTKTFEEAKEICLAGLKPLGEDYLSVLRHAFDSRWIDKYENEGKHGGAYSFGVYGVHPFVLMNYQSNLNDVFTLAHEMGHAMHSYYSHKNQPYVYAYYTIFVAEVASTLNETLVTNYLLSSTTDKTLRMYLINLYLERFRSTLYRQTMFAEFEKLTHSALESGRPLTHEMLSAEYKKLNERYFGTGIVIDDAIALEWARIPHFYTAFYVYKYSTGIAAATALAMKIVKEGQPAVDRYIKFLSSGGSDYPLNQLAEAGVDMRTPEPVEQALKLFGELIEEMEQLI